MLPRSQREIELVKELAALRQRLQNREVESLNLDQFVEAEEYHQGPLSPVTLLALEDILTSSQATGQLFTPHPEIPQAYLLKWRGHTLPVTFSRECFDEHPDTLRFLTYGSSFLADLLDSVPEPDAHASFVRCATDDEVHLRAWYGSSDGKTLQPIETLAELREQVSQSRPTDVADLQAEAQKQFHMEAGRLRQHQAQLLHYQRLAHFLAEKAKAQRVLVKAALIEIALGQQPDLFEADVYPAAFTEEAVLGLQRHGFPWGPLLALAYADGLAPREDDAYYQDIASDKRETLKSRFAQLRRSSQDSGA